MSSVSLSDCLKHTPLRLHIDVSPYASAYGSTSSFSSSSISTRASLATSVDTPIQDDSYYVLCLYDFVAADFDQLSFKKNEILKIVQVEETGWWAAVRQDDQRVGWVPRTFVETISDEVAVWLQTVKLDTRLQEYNAAHYNDSSMVGNIMHPNNDLSSPDPGVRGHHWFPLNEERMKPAQFTADLSTDVSEFGFGPLVTSPDDCYQEVEVPVRSDGLLSSRISQCPPSPLTPMPQPPVPDKPVSSILKHSASLSLARPSPPPQVDHNRTRSETLPTITRHLRRRPVLIDDRTSLYRLSTLFESNNVEEVDFIASSPVIAEEFDAFSRVRSSHRHDKVKRITGEEEAQALHDARVAQVSSPWFIKPIHGEDEIKVEFDGTVTAGTLPALVERLTMEPITPAQGVAYRNAFLTTFKTFASADEIFVLLLQYFQPENPSALSPRDLEQWKQRKLIPAQKQIMNVFQVWIENHGMIENCPHVAQKLQNFLISVASPAALAITAKMMLNSMEHLTFSPSSTPSTPLLQKRKKNSKGSRSQLLRMDPTTIAEHFCLLHHGIYAKIRIQECLNRVHVSTGDSVANVSALCIAHDKLAAWVKRSILYTDVLGLRADTVDFWIKVAEKCRALNNFSSLSAILTALSSAVLDHLHLTWAHASRGSHLEPLAKLNEPSGGFAAFRFLQRTVDGPCVPFIGMYLTDLVHIGDQYTDNIIVASPIGTPISLINFVKRQKWYETIETMLRHQYKIYSFAEDPVVMNFVEASLTDAWQRDQNLLWTKSQEVKKAEMAHADIRKGLEAAGF